jgi:predicted RNA-binding Zn-ribbon protein involved in translation (DUF1610 family)
VSALHRCPLCNGGSWFIEREDKALTVVCLACGERRLIRDGRAEAAVAELAAVRGHMKHGPKPKAEGG